MFSDASSLIASLAPAPFHGVAVADLDGDGRAEIALASPAGPNRILKWRGGQLRDRTPPAFADPESRTHGFAAADLDGDGAEELYALNANPPADRLWKRHPDGRWENLFARPENRVMRNGPTGRAVTAIDRRGAGRYGFVVANDDRSPRFYEFGPDQLLIDLAGPLEWTTCIGSGLLAVPLFGPRTDLLTFAENRPNLLFRNCGDGTFAECATRFRLDDPNENTRTAAAVGIAGRFGVCWGNSDGPHRLMIPQPDGTWRDRATPALAFPSTLRAVVCADFDNDGRDELFLVNHSEPNRLFRIGSAKDCEPDECPMTMLDPGAAAEPHDCGTGAAVIDLDGDGVLELLVTSDESGLRSFAVYKVSSAAGNGWLRIRPQTRFGAPARGAVVQAGIDGRTATRVIDGGNGCQSEPIAHFGLGKHAVAEWVSVTWPDGASLTLREPDRNCTYCVPYPNG